MTIKTIKKRENHINIKYKATCDHCGSDFEAYEKDLEITPHRRPPFQLVPINQPEAIECPECKVAGLLFSAIPILPPNE